MLKAISDLSAYATNELSIQDPIEFLIEYPDATHVLALTFDFQPPTYSGIEIVPFDSDKSSAYFLTKTTPNGPSFSPTTFINQKDPKKSYDMRLIGWMNKVKGYSKQLEQMLSPNDFAWLGSFLEEFDAKSASMRSDLVKSVSDNAGKENRLLTTIRFRDGDRTLWAGSPQLPFRSIYEFLFLKDVFGQSEGDGICCICRKSTRVSGEVGARVFPFATFDQLGFIAGGMKDKDAWRNLPICFDCYTSLNTGRSFVERQMTFKFCGIDYWLIPKFAVSSEQNEEVLHILKYWKKEQSLADDVANSISGDEGEILRNLAESKDFLTLNFVFLKKQKAMERILLSTDDVLPSQLRRIFDAKFSVENIPFLYEKNVRYNLRTLIPFFSKPKGGGKDDVDWSRFLDIVGHTLRQQQLDRATFQATLIERIRQDFAHIQSLRSAALGNSVSWRGNDENGSRWLRPTEAWMNLVFLDSLGILSAPKKGGNSRMAISESELLGNELVQQMDTFFSQHTGTFYNDATKATFMLGSLTQLLLNVQYQDRKATPFLSHLKGLRLTSKDLRALLPQVQNKLQEYERIFAWLPPARMRLAGAVSAYWIRADQDLFIMPSNEVSLYFVMGMNMHSSVVAAKLWPAKDKPDSIDDLDETEE